MMIAAMVTGVIKYHFAPGMAARTTPRKGRAKAAPRGAAVGRANFESSRSSSTGHKHTINDIARLANVSKKTVSRVLNESPFVREETRARVSEIMRKVSYTPDPQARGLAFRRSFLIGLVYDNPNAQYIVNIQEGVLGAIRRSGYELVVHPCDRNSATFLAEVKSFITRQKLDGVILLPPISEDQALARTLREMNCRYIRVMAVPLDDPSNIVLAMDRDAARQVAEHLAKLGHSRIALIAGPRGYRSAHERLSGFSDALGDRGLTLPAEYVVEGAYTFDSGFAAAEILLSRFPRPTAIFACNDEMAAGVYKAAYLKGLRIPADLTVVGYDDSPLASRIWPSLTTVRLPIRDMGKIAAERLIAKIQRQEGPVTPATTVFPHLVVRDSSTRPPSA